MTTKLTYQEKLNAKKERYQQLAENAKLVSDALSNKAVSMLDPLWGGQPILIGHYSEKRHRKLLEKSDNVMRQSIETNKKAQYYKQKAAGVGKGGISSDDEQALDKLSVKLDDLKKYQELMKLANKQYKKGGWNAVTCLTEKEIAELQLMHQRHPYHTKLYTFELSNNLANIKATQKRIDELNRLKQIDGCNESYDHFNYSIDDNRIQFIFDEKPADEVRNLLKRYTFKWSPSRKAWVRKLSNNALFSANILKKDLLKHFSEI